jgi:hypothetical protein
MDFENFGEGGDDVDPKDPIALYESLDKQHTHVELRPGQVQLLAKWAPRRGERDIVLKLATGAGKTTVGLLTLYSHMLETIRPCLFLCPTNQLVDQVVQEAKRCGVPAVAVVGGEEIPPDALAGKAVVITSVQAIFHARAGRFERPRFYAVLIDDAHAAVEIVRQQFRIVIPREDVLYASLLALFKGAMREQSRGTAQEIETGTQFGAVEVPYWTWTEQLDTVTSLLAERSKVEDAAYRITGNAQSPLRALPLVWGLLKNALHGCRCVVAANQIEIAPEVPPVELVKTYHQAERRIFMSATISDDSVLIREMGCAESTATSPIELPDAGGLGERMVLIPRLMTDHATTSIKWEELGELCKRVAEKRTVVVIAPTNDVARKWKAAGAHVVETSAQVPDAIAALRTESKRFVVFANRYDGLDLPDEACRVLVLDGAPVAYSLTDVIDMACSGGGAVRRRTVMHKIEQGLGRAVRSPSDFAVVILFGSDLVELVSMHATRNDLTDQTRKQIELGIEIASRVKKGGDWHAELEDLIWKCVDRDAGWKKLYQARTRSATQTARSDQTQRIAQAVAERRAWTEHISNRGVDAAGTLRMFMNKHGPLDNEGFLVQRVAWYLHKDDPAQSLEAQTRAKEVDRELLMPPKGVQYRKGAAATRPSAAQFTAWLQGFDHVNAAIAAIESLRSRLVFAPEASHDVFEQALCDLGKLLGFESRRPDKETGEGPDVLWLDGQLAVPLEAKNRMSSTTDCISKHVAAQLMQAEAWTKKMYTDRPSVLPLSAHRVSLCCDGAIMPAAAKVLTPTSIAGILDALQGVISAMARAGTAYAPDLASQKLAEAKLTLAGVVRDRAVKPTLP